jgi:hypothetical protein
MSFIIVKWWPAAPEFRQSATQKTFDDREEAERVKAELEKAMPSRRFAVEEKRGSRVDSTQG